MFSIDITTTTTTTATTPTTILQHATTTSKETNYHRTNRMRGAKALKGHNNKAQCQGHPFSTIKNMRKIHCLSLWTICAGQQGGITLLLLDKKQQLALGAIGRSWRSVLKLVREQMGLSENSGVSKACCIRGYDSRYVSEV